MQRDQEGNERGSFPRKAFSLRLLINHTFSALHEPPQSSRPSALANRLSLEHRTTSPHRCTGT